MFIVFQYACVFSYSLRKIYILLLALVYAVMASSTFAYSVTAKLSVFVFVFDASVSSDSISLIICFLANKSLVSNYFIFSGQPNVTLYYVYLCECFWKKLNRVFHFDFIYWINPFKLVTMYLEIPIITPPISFI